MCITHEPILVEKRDRPHHSGTGFSDYVAVMETNYQMLKAVSYSDRERA